MLPIGTHLINGSPVYGGGHIQTALWVIVLQIAFIPQVPGHGSIHFLLTHAIVGWQSEFITHSGRHIGGVPKNPCKHEQTAWLLLSLHWLLGPHGDGIQGFVVIVIGSI